jgi:putative nucleotidyltransferase with HDIG domain
MLTDWAARSAERFLSPLGNRWLHVQQVAEQARRVAGVVVANDRDLLVAAAYLHDVGYARDLSLTGFHPLDGARWVRSQQRSERLARLVAHHSCARYEAEVRGLLDVLMAEFEAEDSIVYDALVFCDMTIGPTGNRVSFDERIDDIYRRYGPEHEVSRALDSSRMCLAACHDRTAARLAGQLDLADVGFLSLL